MTPSWTSGTGGAPPTSCDDPEPLDSLMCTGKVSYLRGQTHCLHLSCMAVTCCHPASSSGGTASKCADLPICLAKASTMCEQRERGPPPWSDRYIHASHKRIDTQARGHPPAHVPNPSKLDHPSAHVTPCLHSMSKLVGAASQVDLP